MIEREATLKHLLAHGHETEILEFKEARKNYFFSKIGKYFSALSNDRTFLNKAKLCISYNLAVVLAIIELFFQIPQEGN